MIIFPILILSIFFITRQTTNELYYLLRRFTKSNNLIFSFVAIFFLPGTIIHELSHYLMATILFLKVHEVKIIPQWDKNSIRLGSVIYEKTDFIRSILVGIAPILGALLFFWWLSLFKIFPSSNIYLNILFGYIVFSVASSMFSSKQDLVDLVYLVPLFIIIFLIIYIFDIRVDLSNLSLTTQLLDFIVKINYYLFISLVINIILVILFKTLCLIIDYSRNR